MALVATINGVQVHSDKHVTEIVNSRVQFADGSWCDTVTGRVVNRGPGFIDIGDSSSSQNQEQTTKGPKKFSASALDIRDVFADVKVMVYSGPDLEVQITGPTSEVEAITSAVRSDTLFIEGTASRGGGTTIIGSGVSIGGGSVSMVSSFGGRVVITDLGGGNNSTQLTVRVPIGTPVSLAGVNGDSVIGDIAAPLLVNIQGGNKISAGRVTSAQLHVQGSGKVQVANVNGDLILQVQGSGRVKIDSGAINNLNASVQGSGRVIVDGTASTASLSSMGSGSIDVEHVRRAPHKTSMGSGSINVRRVG